MTVSFKADIAPLFNQFADQMMWRFDLTDYEHVKANAKRILARISDKGYAMPPPPFEMLSDEQIATFGQWIKEGCPP